MGSFLLGLIVRFLPGGALIAPVLTAIGEIAKAVLSTRIGCAALALAVGIWWGEGRAEKRERAACTAAAERSRAIAAEIDRDAANDALEHMTKQVVDLQELKAKAEAENEKLRKQRRAVHGNGGCMPSDAERRRMRP